MVQIKFMRNILPKLEVAESSRSVSRDGKKMASSDITSTDCSLPPPFRHPQTRDGIAPRYRGMTMHFEKFLSRAEIML
jgi:hypothetical protein